MAATTRDIQGDRPKADWNARNVNINETERKLSMAAGAALVGLGLANGFRLRSLFLAGLGSAAIYRAVTGHCHLYQALGIDTCAQEVQRVRSDDAAQPPARRLRQSVKNRVDKDRFDKLKATQVDRGRDEDKAIEIAAEEVKELRRREGRSKDDEGPSPEEFDES